MDFPDSISLLSAERDQNPEERLAAMGEMSVSFDRLNQMVENRPRPAKESDPCRDLLSEILWRAIRDVDIDHNPGDALEFLESSDAREYADLLGLPEGCLDDVAKRLRKKYNIDRPIGEG